MSGCVLHGGSCQSELSELPGDETVAENEFLDFARAGKRKALDLHPDIRGFLRGHVCAAMGMQRGPVQWPCATDERADDLTPFRVRQADNGDFGHAGVFQQAVLDLGREMVRSEEHTSELQSHSEISYAV